MRNSAVMPRVENERGLRDAARGIPDVDGVARPPQSCCCLATARGLLQLVVPALLLFAGARDVDRAEHLAERRDGAAPAHSNQLAEHLRTLSLGGAAQVATARPGPIEDEVAGAPGIPGGVLDRGRSPA